MRFPGQHQQHNNFNQNNQMGPPLGQQGGGVGSGQPNGPSAGGAKWHIPQASQPQNGFGSSSNNSAPVNDSFKIPLKSLETIKQNLMSNGQIVITPANVPINHNSGNSNMNSGNSLNNTPNLNHQVNIISVTSTNPKTPSPSTNEVILNFTYLLNL